MNSFKLKSCGQKRILIANRGEIAARVARACKELGHVAVGLYTDHEYEAYHLQFCDEWVYLSGKTHAETYLNVDRIVEICEEYKINGVHPGYGFLSENTLFAGALEKKGIVFIGPHSEAIKLMGDKAISKQVAKDAGIPVVPGTASAVKDVEEAVKIAADIGYPVLLKAVAGGGGKGMRACQDEEEVRAQFEAVGREAKSSFGNPDLLVEKLIVNPHHIEVQILADKKGNTFHFFERECSVQRRHQKIIEEAPSPFIGEDEELRNKICETAVILAKAVNYDSAGTVEFIMGENKEFYFLEMNTRIQVEHPITEEITGVDLIILMIQAAFGHDLQIPSQDWIQRTGHAIECRICAEDPITMLPAPGKVTGLDFQFPQGIRFDHCLFSGLEVTPDFDPMVGKLVAKGLVRDIAIRRLLCALDGLYIEGLKNNIPLHKEILKEEVFKEGQYTTQYLYEVKPQEKLKAQNYQQGLAENLAACEAQKMGVK